MLGAVLVVYIAWQDLKGIPTRIFGGSYQVIYMIILHGNITTQQNKETKHGVRSW